MTAATPLLLLDVDGVLNAVAAMPDRSVWRDWEQGVAHTGGTDGREWPICFSPTVTAQVSAWHTEGLAEIRWLTTWQSNATGDLQRLLGLPTFPVVGVEDFEQAASRVTAPYLPGTRRSRSHGEFTVAAAVSSYRSGWWKFDAVVRLVTEDPDRPLVWIDDDLNTFRDARDWVREHTTSLLVAPPPQIGLTPELLREVSAFLAAHR